MYTAAGILFHDTRRRTLLVQPSYKPYWDIPGGIIEHGEAPKTAAAREVKEELGIVVRPGRLLVVDYLPQHRRRPEMLAFVFDGGHVDDTTIAVDNDEILSWQWCDGGRRADLLGHAPILFRRIHNALQAASTGGTLMLESGWPT